MTLFPFSWRARTGAPHVRDHSVALILFVLLALVFAPVIGLHVALASIDAPDPVRAPNSSIAHTPSTKDQRS
jgi:hypothetical protein